MPVVYESRLSLSSFWCKEYCGGGVQTLSTYLKSKLKGSSGVATLKLQPNKDGVHWFTLRYGTDRQRQESRVGIDSLVQKDITLDRVSYELGWTDRNEWDASQVTWRLDSFEDRKPLSVCSLVVVASRTAKTPRFSVTNGKNKYTWVPLHALFPDLPHNAKFVGWQRASALAKQLKLEKVDEAYMFEKLFPSIYGDYVRTLLHLPIAVGKDIVKTVDFRDAQPKAFEALLDKSGINSPDAMFRDMVTSRVPIGVSENGRLLAFPRLPSRPAVIEFMEIKRCKIQEGADIVPVETAVKQPNWYASFPIVNTSECLRVNIATLDILDPFILSNFVQRNIFPHSSRFLPTGVVNKFFTWRMKWTYAFLKLLTIPRKSSGDFESKVCISLLEPWN